LALKTSKLISRQGWKTVSDSPPFTLDLSAAFASFVLHQTIQKVHTIESCVTVTTHAIIRLILEHQQRINEATVASEKSFHSLCDKTIEAYTEGQPI